MTEDRQHNDEMMSEADPMATDGTAPIDESGDTAYAGEPRSGFHRAALGLMALIAVGAVGLYYMHARRGPQQAQAATAAQAEATQTINRFLSDGDAGIRAMRELLKNTEKVVQRFAQFPAAAQVPPESLRSNPFHFDSINKAVDDSAARRNETKQAMLAAVQKLRLQSIIHSDRAKACMINNVLVKEGDQAAGFVIEAIEPARVIVRRDAYRFELRMQK